jgi:pimeloyl-ACP methyl ester carboxylesterase
MRRLTAILWLTWFAATLTCCGCCAAGPRPLAFLWHPPLESARASPNLAQATLARAQALESAGSEACVEAYFEACSLAWNVANHQCSHGKEYSVALAGLLTSAQRFGRLDAARGLFVRQGDELILVPAAHHGFSWQPADFQRLQVPTDGHEPLLQRRYRCPGLGTPLVFERYRNDGDPLEARLLPSRTYFAATAVLRFANAIPTLEFYNPFLIRNFKAQSGPLPLAADYSAPLARSLEVAPRTYLAGFVQPGQAETAARLHLLEPYQPGKAPVVLIHGLFSDPLSWADLVNDLRATPGFAERYQIWYFRYPTGQGFLQSAAALRRELQACLFHVDPERRDPALRQVVLVGHSMGGLIAKLQVTHSEDRIWSRLANRPLDELAATDEARTLLAETCFFEPSPDVSRLIFIATPHAGSLVSSAVVGRGASLLVEPAPQQAAIHQQLIHDNPGVFNPEFESRLPTSIDMLSPRSPLLEAMHNVPIRAGVRLHNILGVSHPVSLDGPSDGVVSVHSASHPACQSVRAIGEKHSNVHRAPETSAEILRILKVGLPAQSFSQPAREPAPAPRRF